MSLSLIAMAQDREQYVISATNDDLDCGDLVQIGSTGRVEVLLNPGSYLRASENSEFELTNTSPDSLQVKVMRGSFIVEVTGADEARTLIDVATPQSSLDRPQRCLPREEFDGPIKGLQVIRAKVDAGVRSVARHSWSHMS